MMKQKTRKGTKPSKSSKNELSAKAKAIINNSTKTNFRSFLFRCFEELNPSRPYIHNWHIEEMCQAMQSLMQQKAGRLIITMPPRYLKSICVSVATPAWLLGNNPETRIIAASYSQALANQHSMSTKRVMQSNWYKAAFPQTIIKKGQNQKHNFATASEGFRFATSIQGSLTGLGGDYIMVDDPHKPSEINNTKIRNKTIDWFFNTLYSRLNDKKTGKIIVVMQRLHKEDLAGILLKIKNEEGAPVWQHLNLEAIATMDTPRRIAGEPLHKEREGTEVLDAIRQGIGTQAFEAQYQQNPAETTGGIIKKSWVQYTTALGQPVQASHSLHGTFEGTSISPEGARFISVDTAIKTNEESDYTAITLWRVVHDKEAKNETFLLEEIISEKLEFFELKEKTLALIAQHTPHKVIIEDKGSGISLIQELTRIGNGGLIHGFRPGINKMGRLAAASVFFEARQVFINPNAQNLKHCIEQLTTFPATKHDDIADSISMLLNWYSTNRVQWGAKPQETSPGIRFL